MPHDVEHRTSGATRDSAIYVSWQTRKALSYIPREPDESPDSLAEQILADWLKANHPKIVEHLRTQYQTDQEFKKNYKP